jgi:hypothetical protein
MPSMYIKIFIKSDLFLEIYQFQVKYVVNLVDL